MILVAALAWYAESTETLDRCVRSLGGVCDVVVALGGRWENFPAIWNDDADAQARAIKDAATEAGIFSTVHWQTRPYRSQVAKRAQLMEAARSLGDWVFVIDADEYIADANTQEIGRLLEATRADAASVHGIRVPSKVQARRPWRRMYRASTGVTVEVAHNGYRTEDGRWLYGDPAHVQLEPAVDLTEHLLLVHALDARDDERRAARQAYVDARREQGFEKWPERVAA